MGFGEKTSKHNCTGENYCVSGYEKITTEDGEYNFEFHGCESDAITNAKFKGSFHDFKKNYYF